MANVATYSLGCTRHCISHGPLRNRQSVRSAPSAAPQKQGAQRGQRVLWQYQAWPGVKRKATVVAIEFLGTSRFPAQSSCGICCLLAVAINKSWQANKNGINWTCICIFRMDAKFDVNNHQPLSTIQAGNTRHLDRWFCKKN